MLWSNAIGTTRWPCWNRANICSDILPGELDSRKLRGVCKILSICHGDAEGWRLSKACNVWPLLSAGWSSDAMIRIVTFMWPSSILDRMTEQDTDHCLLSWGAAVSWLASGLIPWEAFFSSVAGLWRRTGALYLTSLQRWRIRGDLIKNVKS